MWFFRTPQQLVLRFGLDAEGAWVLYRAGCAPWFEQAPEVAPGFRPGAPGPRFSPAAASAPVGHGAMVRRKSGPRPMKSSGVCYGFWGESVPQWQKDRSERLNAGLRGRLQALCPVP